MFNLSKMRLMSLEALRESAFAGPQRAYISWAQLLEGRVAILPQNVDVRNLLTKVKGRQHGPETEVHGHFAFVRRTVKELDAGALLSNSRVAKHKTLLSGM